MTHFCFKKGCLFKAEYVCLCLACETYCCEFHLKEHLKLPNRTHAFDSVLEEPFEWTKLAILGFLAKEKSKKEKLNKILMTDFNTQGSEIRISESIRNLDYDLEQINSLTEKFSQVSEQESCPIPNPLSLETDIDTKKIKSMALQNSNPYSSLHLFLKLQQLRKKKSEILNRADNDPEAEENYKKACLLYENYIFDPLIRQTLQELKDDYQKMTSLYLADVFNAKTNLFIYSTVSEREEMKALETPGQFKDFASMVRLSNGELFFISEMDSNIYCYIIDRNYKLRELPSGLLWKYSSAVYFNKSVYCFGGKDRNTYILKCSSSRFDLDENRWVQLTPMPKRDFSLNSVIFNGNIVISGYDNSSLFLYSIDIESFSEISIDIQANRSKILINAE